MIKKYKFGAPFETGTVEKNINCADGAVSYFNSLSSGVFNYALNADDIVYGLGEQVRGINKRGWKYESNCADDCLHTECKSSLYAAHNFLVVDGADKFGVFVDFGGNVKYDIGYENINTLTISVSQPDFYIYIIEAQTAEQTILEFRELIGMSYIPPKWAFGFMQSRWGYKTEEDIRNVADSYKKAEIPLDSICMDIDYMERYKDFTVDKERFPDLKKFSAEMKQRDLHLVPIIDAGVKIEKGYDVYEEGVRSDYFCKRADGSDFVAGVWPGRTHFPDFLNKDARRWFGGKYKILLDMGIDGFWNDMNEPAIFYSDEGLSAAFKRFAEIKDNPLDIDSFFELQALFNNVKNSPADYSAFYHNVDGEKIRHDKVHNLYGYNMTKAASEAFPEALPDKRILLFSRASAIGMHRYGGVWTGDNSSWWSHIALSMCQLVNLNMCGFLFAGSDIGGFSDNTTADLLLRWTQFAIFAPLMRNHSAAGTREQEYYRFPELIDDFRAVLKLRYSLIPYLYSEFMKAALDNKLYFKPLAFAFPNDEIARQTEDQIMLGNELMLAPVMKQNAMGRYVYLPEEMLLVRFSKSGRTVEKLSQGTHFINVALGETPLFIRKNAIIPLAKPAMSTAQIDASELELLGFVDGSASYELYEDDGVSTDYSNAKRILFTVNKNSLTQSDGRTIELSLYN